MRLRSAKICEIPVLRLLQAISFGVFLILLASMCRGVFGWLAHSVFNEPREDMAHGWFVPLFSLALLWLKRRELAQAAAAPSPAGLLLAAPGFALFSIGVLGDQLRLSLLAAIWLLWAALYSVWGRRLAHVAAFAVAFLLFTMPMGFLDIFTVKLRIAIAALSSILLNGLGIETIRNGTGLYCAAGSGFSIDIADPCSGMRSIFALAALTAGYAYLTQETLRGKWLLFACSAPIAMLGNLARIFSIALVSLLFGKRIGQGFYHDYSGYVIFLVAVMAMRWTGDLVSRLFSKRGAPSEHPERMRGASDAAAAQERHMAGSRHALALATPILLPLMAIATMRHIANAPPRIQESDAFVAERLGEIPGYTAQRPVFCQNEHCLASAEVGLDDQLPPKCAVCGGRMDFTSLPEHRILPGDTRIMKCNYYDSLGYAWRVSVVVNGRSRQSIHRPEICLPAQGWSIERGSIEKFRLSDGETLAMHCMNVRPRSALSGSAARQGHAYFFVNARTRAASHLKRILISVRDRALAGRITRWAMVTVNADAPFADSERRREATAAFLSEFLPMAFPGQEPESTAIEHAKEDALE